jgi:hypothetical protein
VRSDDNSAFCVHIWQPSNEAIDLQDLEAIKQNLVDTIVHEHWNTMPLSHIHKCITSGIPVTSIVPSTAVGVSKRDDSGSEFEEIAQFMVPWKPVGPGFEVIGKYANRQRYIHRREGTGQWRAEVSNSPP